MRFTGLSEFVIYGLLFLAVVGFNLFKQIASAQRDKARRQTRPAPRKQEEDLRPQPVSLRPEPPVEPATREAELAEQRWGRAPEPAPDHMPAAVMEPAQPLAVVLAQQMVDQWRDADKGSARPAEPPGRSVPSARRRSSRQLIRHRGELRHAIVLMTVLGPCRASQPYDQNRH